MGYKCSFLDNEVYGADDINAVFARLTTRGVTPCPEGKSVFESMNDAVAETVTEGISLEGESMRVSLEDGFIRIAPGTAFFADGVSMVIDESGAELPLNEGGYVYLFRDVNRNCCDIKVEKELPEGDFILLAEVKSDGTVTDKRGFASSKLLPNSTAVARKYTVTFSYSKNTSTETPIAAIDAGFSSFTYLLFKCSSPRAQGFYELEEGVKTEYYSISGEGDFCFEKVGDKVNIYILPQGTYGTYLDMEIILL